MAAVEAEAPETSNEETAPEYAVVEVYGHRSHAGRVIEIERFGSKMLRIDIPKDGDFEAGFTTHFYGGGAIFSLTPCDLPTVQRVNRPYVAASRLTYSEPDDDDEERPF